MPDATQSAAARVPRLVHCLRAPVGGLFRHVRDLAEGQAGQGFEVGIICDSRSGDDIDERALADLGRLASLGVHRIPMSRGISPSDVSAALAVRRHCSALGADIIHGHGAKGGAYARFAGFGRPVRVFYTPHGGSLHYSRTSPAGFTILSLERLLDRFTDGLIFESRYGLETYSKKVRTPSCAARVVFNGLKPEEVQPVALAPDAADFLFIGELRSLKGVDVLLHALSALQSVRDVTAVVVGSGPDTETFKRLAQDLGLNERVAFRDPMPAREAFTLGRTLVVPSRAESFPYIVLEGLAAAKPVVATNVGGIPEMFGPHKDSLISPDNVPALSAAMAATLTPDLETNAMHDRLRDRIASKFSVTAMVEGVNRFYETADPAPVGRNRPVTVPHQGAE